MPYRQKPGRVCICVTVRAPLRTSHPTVARGPAKGYFTCTNPSAAVPVTYPPPQAVRPGLHFCIFPPHRPDAHLRPFPLPALCSDQWGHPPRYMLVEITHGNALGCALIPGAPPLDLDRFCLAARALCLFLFHVFYVCFSYTKNSKIFLFF